MKNEDTEIKNEIAAIVLVFGFIALGNWYQIYYGYKENKSIYNENILRIQEFVEENKTQEEQANKELIILLPKDDRYGFTAMAGIDWIDESIKGYFGINSSVTLRGVEKDSEG